MWFSWNIVQRRMYPTNYHSAIFIYVCTVYCVFVCIYIYICIFGILVNHALLVQIVILLLGREGGHANTNHRIAPRALSKIQNWNESPQPNRWTISRSSRLTWCLGAHMCSNFSSKAGGSQWIRIGITGGCDTLTYHENRGTQACISHIFSKEHLKIYTYNIYKYILCIALYILYYVYITYYAYIIWRMAWRILDSNVQYPIKCSSLCLTGGGGLIGSCRALQSRQESRRAE